MLIERRVHARDDVLPVTCCVLPEQPQRRVPRAVVAIEQPPPTGIVAIKQPKRFSERAGKVGDRSIHRNDEVEVFDQRSRIGKVCEIVGPVGDAVAQRADAQLRDGVLAFLQTVKFAVLDLNERGDLIEGDAALPIAPIGATHLLPRVPSPHQADPKLLMLLAEAVPPCVRFGLRYGQITFRCRYGVDFRLEREWQTQQGAMKIERGQRLALGDDLCRGRQRAHQLTQGHWYFKNDVGAASGDKRRITAEL
jgi:hypothetical protein